MIFGPKTIALKSGTQAIFRSPTTDDAAALLEYLRITAEETPYLLRYPEECNMTMEEEVAFIAHTLRNPSVTMILCEINGVIAGNCRLERHNKLKTRHRASIGIALKKEFWNLGIGTAMFTEMIRLAREAGICQLELEVFETNRRAMALYEKMGFRIAAEHPNAIRLRDGTMLCEYLMVKELV